jgi:hypothetical protein
VAEEVARTFDWKELLDLLEEVGGSEKAADLFERHVVGATEAELFADRATSREEYQALLESGDGWAVPTSIRLAMTDWRFESANGLMDEAAAILETKAELLALTADLDVSDELALQDTYEAGKKLGDVAEAADEAVGTARALGDAEDSVAAGAGPIGAIGLLFNGADDELDDAQSAFDGGDYESALASANDAEEVVDGAVVAGIIRILGLLVLVAVGFFLRRAWKAHRRRQADGAAPLYGPPAPEPMMAALSETDGAEGVGGAVDDVGKLGM